MLSLIKQFISWDPNRKQLVVGILAWSTIQYFINPEMLVPSLIAFVLFAGTMSGVAIFVWIVAVILEMVREWFELA